METSSLYIQGKPQLSYLSAPLLVCVNETDNFKDLEYAVSNVARMSLDPQMQPLSPVLRWMMPIYYICSSSFSSTSCFDTFVFFCEISLSAGKRSFFFSLKT